MAQDVASGRLRFPHQSLFALGLMLASPVFGGEERFASASSSPKVALSGRVIDRATKSPIAGVEVIVSVRSLDEAEGSPSTPAPTDLRRTTGADGRFSLTLRVESDAPRLPGVSIFVRHPDYVWRKSERFSLAMLAAARDLGAKSFCDEITLQAGIEHRAQVVSPTDEPVAGVEFEFWAQSEEHIVPHFTDDLRGTSDASGWYRGRMPQSPFIHARITPERFAPLRYRWDAGDRTRFPTEEIPEELGRFILDPGVTLSGRVIGIDDRPIAGLTVEATNTSEELTRIARSDADGRFAFAPMHPGLYVVGASSQGFWSGRIDQADPGLRRPIGTVLAPLNRGWWSFPVQLRELPSVRVRARFVDSSGRPTRGNRVVVNGAIPNPGRQTEPLPLDTDPEEVIDAMLAQTDTDGLAWNGRANPDADGNVVINVPRGLHQPRISTEDSTGEFAYTMRLTPDGEVTPNGSGSLGELRHDVEGIEFRAFRSPSIFVNVVQEGTLFREEINVSAYLTVNKALQASGRATREGFGRYRIRGILSGYPYTIYANSNNFMAAGAEGICLPEGGTVEITLTLTKTPAPANVGDLAPPLLVTTLDGKARSLADYGGRYVLVTVWEPDQAEETLKILKDIQEKFGDNPKFAMLGLSYENDREAIVSKVKEKKIDWPVARLGIAFQELRAAYGWQQFPTSFLVGPDGKIVEKDIEEDGLMSAVAGAMKQ